MEKYYEKKAIRSGSLRVCKKCSSQLSRYNESTLCSSCSKKTYLKDKLMGMINEID
jgi:hypothetical protein